GVAAGGWVCGGRSSPARRPTIAGAAALGVGWTTPTGGMKPADIERPNIPQRLKGRRAKDRRVAAARIVRSLPAPVLLEDVAGMGVGGNYAIRSQRWTSCPRHRLHHPGRN